MQQVVVTGAAGLVGSYMVRKLIAEGDSIIYALCRNRQAVPEDLRNRDRLQWVEGDILDVVLLDELFEGKTQVYHCAGRVSFNPRRKEELFQINIEGTANVVNACLNRGVGKLLHVSSVSALGRSRPNQTITEDMQWDENSNNSNYGESKFYAEMEVWRGISEGLESVIVNPTIILGAGNWESGSLAIFKNAWNEFPWYTDGISGFVDVEDVAKAMYLLMNSGISGERFIISAENWPFRQVFTRIAEGLGKKPPYRPVKPWMSELVWRLESWKNRLTGKDPLLTKETAHTARMKVYFDNGRILKALPGFSFRPLEETIRLACEYYLSQRSNGKAS